MSLTTSMLDIAPTNDSELLHPEWAEPQASTASTVSYYPNVEGPYGERRNQELDGLLRFLSNQGIAHEVVPGGHLMIKLKQNINFKTGSSNVSQRSQWWLDELSSYIANQPNMDVVIGGHTDDTGTVKFNDTLSEKRALQVKQQLMKRNVRASSIYTRGYGQHMPSCSNVSPSGKACNRRVELTFILAKN